MQGSHLSKGPPPVRIERFEEYVPMHPTEWKSKKGVAGASQPHWRTDIDFQDAEGVMYNSKRGWGFDEADAARRAENWIRAVQHEKSIDFDKIKFVVPEGTEVPKPVQDALTAMIKDMQRKVPGLGERLGGVSRWQDFFRLDGPRKPID